jgi:hypothetical protein
VGLDWIVKKIASCFSLLIQGLQQYCIRRSLLDVDVVYLILYALNCVPHHGFVFLDVPGSIHYMFKKVHLYRVGFILKMPQHNWMNQQITTHQHCLLVALGLLSFITTGDE